MPFQYGRYVGSAILVGFIFWLLNIAGLLEPMNRMAYDLCYRARTRIGTHPAEVLLVYLDEETVEKDTSYVLRLVDLAKEYDAAGLAFTFFPGMDPADLERVTREHSKLAWGHQIVRDPFTGEASCSLLQLPANAVQTRSAAIGVAPDSDGVLRRHQTEFWVGNRTVPALEALVTGAPTEAIEGHAPAGFGVAFAGGPGSLPHVTYKDVVNDAVIRQLVADKVLLVGKTPRPDDPGIVTPTTSRNRRMSRLEFHGHALNTLLSGRGITESGAGVTLILLVAVSAATSLLLRKYPLWLTWVILPGLFLLGLSISFLLLIAVNLWLPCATIAGAQLACAVLVIHRKAQLGNQVVNRLLLDVSGVLRRCQVPVGSFSEAEPWPQLISYLHQTLQVRRLVVLETSPDSYYVRETQTFQCQMADIAERRRDYRRRPYSNAIESGQPQLLDRPYFHSDEQRENQYIVPLLFSGELFGFVALSVATRDIAKCTDFEQRLGECADKVAKLLYSRQCVLADRRGPRQFSSLFGPTHEVQVSRDLTYALDLVQQRLLLLEDTFEKSSTPFAIYDLFGRPLMMNGGMLKLLTDQGSVPMELTAVDLVATLAQCDLDQARQRLRRVTVDTWQEAMPFTLGSRHASYVLNMRPLELKGSQTSVSSETPAESRLEGILCEVIDRTSVMENLQLKGQLADELGITLRNDLASVDFAASLMSAESVAVEERQTFESLIHDKVAGVVATLEQCERFLMSDVCEDSTDCYPIDAGAAVEASIRTVNDAALVRDINIDLMRPELTGHVLANPKQLTRAFTVALELIVADARDGTTVQFVQKEEVGRMVFTLTNQGIGMSPDMLTRLLDDSFETKVDEHRRFREACQWVRHWGGRVTLTSELGSGTTCQVALCRFGGFSATT